jgi:hypothetical protein
MPVWIGVLPNRGDYGAWYFVGSSDTVALQVKISVVALQRQRWNGPDATGNVFVGGNAAATEVADGAIDEVGIWKSVYRR